MAAPWTVFINTGNTQAQMQRMKLVFHQVQGKVIC
jgi:hypothetical protein